MSRTRLRVLAATAILVVATGCTSDAVPTPADTETKAETTVGSGSDPAASVRSKMPKRLMCPSGEAFRTDGGLLVAGAELKGTETAGQAVEKWMEEQGGADYVLTGDAAGAWVLRANGTARAKLTLLLSDGWVVHGYEACS